MDQRASDFTRVLRYYHANSHSWYLPRVSDQTSDGSLWEIPGLNLGQCGCPVNYSMLMKHTPFLFTVSSIILLRFAYVQLHRKICIPPSFFFFGFSSLTVLHARDHEVSFPCLCLAMLVAKTVLNLRYSHTRYWAMLDVTDRRTISKGVLEIRISPIESCRELVW